MGRIKKTDKGVKEIRVSEAVDIYNTLKGLKVGRLPKEEQFRIIRNARALKSVATSFEDFLSDAREKLKPEGFDAIMEKSRRFTELPDEEKREVNEAVAKYNKDVEDCVRTELEKTVEIDGLARLSEDSLPLLAETNDLNVETMLMLEEM